MTWAAVMKAIIPGKARKDEEQGKPQEHGTDGRLNFISGWQPDGKKRQSSRYHAEKRRFRRYRDGQRTLCFSMMSRAASVQILDASLSGLRLKADSMIRVNTDIGIVLNFKGESAHFQVRVLWEAKEHNSYQYGVTFARHDAERNAQVLKYLAHLKS